jgi:hypothetical protein
MYLLNFDAKTVLLIDLSFSTRNGDVLAVRGESSASTKTHTHKDTIPTVKCKNKIYCSFILCIF